MDRSIGTPAGLSAPDEISRLVNLISKLGTSTGLKDEKTRRALVAASHSLSLALETPMEALLRMYWAESTLRTAIHIGLDMQLFHKMAEDNGSPKTLAKLAEMTKAESVLLSRLLKHLASMDFIRETGTNTYIHTPLSQSMTNPTHRDTIYHIDDSIIPALQAVPEFLKANKYRNPTDPLHAPFQIAHKHDRHAFEWFSAKPERLNRFHNHMAGCRIGRAKWIDPGCVPVEEVLGKDCHPEDVLLVDVGGGNGYDIAEFHQRYPNVPGRLILQDLPDVIASVQDLPDAVEPMAHDFFTEQPIKGARAYYLKSILHNWPDDKCKEILKNIIPAMRSGYTKILINDKAIPDKGAAPLSTAVDLIMLATFASRERIESDWRQLLEDVGLRVLNIWTYDRGAWSLIEAELA